MTPDEMEEMQALIDGSLDRFHGFECTNFLKDLPLTAYRMPPRLVRFLNDFRYSPPKEGYCVVSTGLVIDKEIGPTPVHWELKTNNDTCQEAVMCLCLCATVLGDIYGWLTQQDGRFVHDILPIKKHEYEQIGSGSKEELTLHTEDAFHELRGDYLLLMCMRNNDNIPTTLSKPDYTKLSSAQIDILFEKHFVIKPDNSHKPKHGSAERKDAIQSGELSMVEAAYAEMCRRDSEPEKIAVLFGNKADPCLRIDPYFMERPEDPMAAEAMDKLIELVSESMVEIALKPGEFIVIDNYEVVHGRKPFQARYDGTDRWYKRINVIRDVRRCNHVLETKQSRIVY